MVSEYLSVRRSERVATVSSRRESVDSTTAYFSYSIKAITLTRNVFVSFSSKSPKLSRASGHSTCYLMSQSDCSLKHLPLLFISLIASLISLILLKPNNNNLYLFSIRTITIVIAVQDHWTRASSGLRLGSTKWP